MSEPDPSDASMSASAALRVDALCDRFESEWRAGRRMRVEEALATLPEAQHRAAASELILMELSLRRASGEAPLREEYDDRFPELSEAVESAFHAAPTSAGHDPQLDPPAGYKILGTLGRGGMGVVYRARQVGLNRDVALKMIVAGAHASDAMRARFLAEARSIARLRHPNVVQVFDLGDHRGLPFLAMEYHAGGSLAARLDGTPRPGREAAALVRQVALGVAEAHRLGIVHRDLKPANILLADDGTPKVADFGLAKSMESAGDLTATEHIVGTPSYMSPEQARPGGATVLPTSDVYALGAVLYELLTGRPPFKGTSVIDTLDQVRASEPVPPSRLVPGIDRDLETITLTCLHKDAGRRYVDATALADDLSRYLDHRPIVARRTGALGRAWRLARRHPQAAALSAALLVSLVGGLGATTWAWRGTVNALGRESMARKAAADSLAAETEQRIAAERAEAEAKVAREAEARQRLAAEASERVARAATGRAEAISDFLINKLLMQANPVNNKVSDDVRLIDVLDRAAGQLDTAFPNEPDTEMELRAVVGELYRSLGRLDKMEPHLRAALALGEKHRGADDSHTLEVLNSLGAFLNEVGRLDEAEPILRRNYETRLRLLGPDHVETNTALNNLAQLVLNRGELADAERLFRQLVETTRRTLGQDDRKMLASEGNLVVTLIRESKLEEAEPIARRNLEARIRVLGAEHPETLIARSALGVLYQRMGRLDEALDLLRANLEARLKVLGPRHPSVALAEANVGNTLRRMGRDAEAIPYLRRAVEIGKVAPGPDHPNTLGAESGLGQALAQTNALDEAEPILRRNLAACRRVLGPNHADTRGTSAALAHIERLRAAGALVIPADPFAK